MPRFAPLTEIGGVEWVTAGALARVRRPWGRVSSDAQVAADAGVAPVATSSVGHVRHRLNRGGHRQRTAILYRIALTQARHSPQARAYLERRVAEGKTKREATRALTRPVVRVVWRQWVRCWAEAPKPEEAAVA